MRMYARLEQIGIKKLSDALIGFLVKMSHAKNIMVKMNDHKIPTKKRHIQKVITTPATVPSQVLFLFQEM